MVRIYISIIHKKWVAKIRRNRNKINKPKMLLETIILSKKLVGNLKKEQRVRKRKRKEMSKKLTHLKIHRVRIVEKMNLEIKQNKLSLLLMKE